MKTENIEMSTLIKPHPSAPTGGSGQTSPPLPTETDVEGNPTTIKQQQQQAKSQWTQALYISSILLGISFAVIGVFLLIAIIYTSNNKQSAGIKEKILGNISTIPESPQKMDNDTVFPFSL
jgi:hypothetical protein